MMIYKDRAPTLVDALFYDLAVTFAKKFVYYICFTDNSRNDSMNYP